MFGFESCIKKIERFLCVIHQMHCTKNAKRLNHVEFLLDKLHEQIQKIGLQSI